MKRVLLIAGAFAILLLGWLFRPRADESIADRELRAGVAASPTGQPRTHEAKSAAAAEPRSELADALNSPSTAIDADLRLIAGILDGFRSNFPGMGNPAGDNAEITAALTGKNKLRLALVPPDHAAINAAGELCDRWATPLFFHAESATNMEIRSAGPDRTMWNHDDVVLSP